LPKFEIKSIYTTIGSSAATQHKTSIVFPKQVDAPRKTPPSNTPTRHGSNTRKIGAAPNSCEGENSVASKKKFCRHH
jgi:hypothetical protein